MTSVYMLRIAYGGREEVDNLLTLSEQIMNIRIKREASLHRHEIGGDIADLIAELNQVPAIVFVNDRHLGAVVELGDGRRVKVRPAVNIQGAQLRPDFPGQGIAVREEGNAEIFCEGEHDALRHGVDVGDDPLGVVRVVVEPQLQQDRRRPDPANLADGGGGFRADQVGKGVDGLEAIG